MRLPQLAVFSFEAMCVGLGLYEAALTCILSSESDLKRICIRNCVSCLVLLLIYELSRDASRDCLFYMVFLRFWAVLVALGTFVLQPY